jgi:hypothetical protein
MSRPDPALNLLKDLGFLPVRLPKADIKPLQIVSKDGKDFNLLGDVQEAMVAEPGVTVPPVFGDIQTANQVEGQRTARIKLSVGVNILGNILRALTGQNLDVSAGYQGAKTIAFQFSDVTVDRVDIVLLDRYLNRSDIHPDLRHIEELMIEDRVGIITATLKSKKYLTTAQDDRGIDISINVPVIKGIAGGTVSVGSTNSGNTQVAYEGATPVSFGFQAARLFFDDKGNYTAFDPFKVGEGALRGLGLAAASTPVLFDVEGAFARVETAAARGASVKR